MRLDSLLFPVAEPSRSKPGGGTAPAQNPVWMPKMWELKPSLPPVQPNARFFIGIDVHGVDLHIRMWGHGRVLATYASADTARAMQKCLPQCIAEAIAESQASFGSTGAE